MSDENQGWKFLLRALRSRNYRLFFTGQGLSLIGTWLTFVAQSWLVYRLSHSALILGLVSFLGQIPSFFLAPVAGVYVDRLDRHRILLATQTVMMLQSFALAILTLSGLVTVWHIFALSLVQGLASAFDMPARQSFVVEMIESKEDLGNAIALNSSLFNSARLIGPSIAGILIAAFGEGICFLVDGISYVAVLLALLAMRLPPLRPTPSSEVRHALREGFDYVVGSSCLHTILLFSALISLMAMPYSVLMPIMATQILHGGPSVLGLLMTATGVGALVGLFFLASRKSVVGFGRIIPSAAILFGVGLILFSLSRSLWLSVLLLCLVGGGMVVQMAASNTLLQTLVEEDKRGRVMSFYTMAFAGMAPFGSLLAGTLASRFGAPTTIAFGGLACLLGALLFSLRLPVMRQEAHPIYQRKGILPEIATGMQNAARFTTPPESG